jgi:hypothetical protein
LEQEEASMIDPLTAALYLAELHSRVSSAEELCFLAVSLGIWRPEPGRCHENVQFWVERNPHCQAISGWLVANEKYFIAHAVVHDPAYPQLLDITPPDANGPPHSMRFIRHTGSSEEFFEIRQSYPQLNWAGFFS